MAALRWIGFVLAGVLAILGTVLTFAPAAWLDVGLREASLGRVRLAGASGSIWDGRGTLVFQEAVDSGAPRAAQVAQGMALPGEIRWHVRMLPLLLGIVEADVKMDGMPAPVRLGGGLQELRVGAGALDLPSADLSRLGSPWNTIRPSAALSTRWEPLSIRQGVLTGRVSIELRDVTSAMTPVRPLGTYRIDVNGAGSDVNLSLSTLSGPLQLQGSGSWDRRAGVRFEAQARAEGPERQRLQSLLGLIGRREGERTVIRIGA
ncbi:MAG TPA: type II secretion system protein N [Quisquiliibacterium sp.]|nr:type II secretion system protein N [Quisquiliibacterium sp.]HPA88388.1 type II secretion system protein N [Quisquiliibacterium sp.]HQD82029.1 type II secretion system protein N [Quisquiliibacterium sp.]HQN11759.1 type II secretion system protein N [Quisquiliibacterium sp.]HQP67353.1 type II secretion system protein N [Quisquiliibacterium sp.]